MVVAGRRPFAADGAHLPPQWHQGCGTGERPSYDGVIVQLCRFGASAEKPPEALAEVNGEEAVDDGVQAGIEEAKDEQNVGQRVGDLPFQVIREEPVPQAQQVVGSPADDKGGDDDDAHFQGSHPSFGDVILGTPQMHFIGGHWGQKRNRKMFCWCVTEILGAGKLHLTNLLLVKR